MNSKDGQTKGGNGHPTVARDKDEAAKTERRTPAGATDASAPAVDEAAALARQGHEASADQTPLKTSVSAGPRQASTPTMARAPIADVAIGEAVTAFNPDTPAAASAAATSGFDRSGKVILKDRFVLLELLGAGGMGNVYLAKDLLREELEDSDPHVAIKVLNDECRQMPGALQSLQREAKKAQALSHPNIVTVYDFDRDGDTAFITMEYISGQELKQCLQASERLPHERAMHIVERVARGLAYAHQQGFAHSDIKPANVFLGRNDSVKILDFGIAKAFTEASKEKRSAADDLTEGALTPAYASLEMLGGASAIASDDVYSLACMAYEMISGRHPFIGVDDRPMPADIAKAAGAKVIPIAGIPRRHMRALYKGLEFERKDRFADAGEFIDAIKPRNWRRELSLLAVAVVLAGGGFYALDLGLQRVVPSVDSLQPAMGEVAALIKEADEFLALQDASTANRLYAQAWDEANYLTAADITEREKVQAILQDRMNNLSAQLISKSESSDIDEYQLRELFVALEFLLRGEQTNNEKNIKRALASIEKRINELDP